jgi:hypothetical protein
MKYLRIEKTVRSGKYPGQAMNPLGGWNLVVTKYKRVRLPLLSYEGRRLRCYFGWRECGKFGSRFNVKIKTIKDKDKS